MSVYAFIFVIQLSTSGGMGCTPRTEWTVVAPDIKSAIRAAHKTARNETYCDFSEDEIESVTKGERVYVEVKP